MGPEHSLRQTLRILEEVERDGDQMREKSFKPNGIMYVK